MRLWSLHPMYLDRQGLVALWRETLLAQAVLRGQTHGYRNHPQLERFRSHPAPLSAISHYQQAIHAEATSRGYTFDKSKIGKASRSATLAVTTGQLEYEWAHLMNKLKARDPALWKKWQGITTPSPHPMFEAHPGPIEPWERV